MHRTTLALLAVLACAGHGPAREGRLGVQTREDPRFVLRGDDPFWAAGGVTIELDHPSYVAVFLVFSRGVVRAFYPYEDGQGNHYLVGRHVLRPRPDPTLVGQSAAFAGPVLFAVASDRPLQLSQLKGRVEGYAGIQATTYRFSAGSMRQTMEALAREIVAATGASNWTGYYYSW